MLNLNLMFVVCCIFCGSILSLFKCYFLLFSGMVMYDNEFNTKGNIKAFCNCNLCMFSGKSSVFLSSSAYVNLIVIYRFDIRDCWCYTSAHGTVGEHLLT